ncbi:hypothetical protein B1218_36435, partial [Pseudomonas ogarae]
MLRRGDESIAAGDTGRSGLGREGVWGERGGGGDKIRITRRSRARETVEGRVDGPGGGRQESGGGRQPAQGTRRFGQL